MCTCLHLPLRHTLKAPNRNIFKFICSTLLHYYIINMNFYVTIIDTLPIIKSSAFESKAYNERHIIDTLKLYFHQTKHLQIRPHDLYKCKMHCPALPDVVQFTE